MDLIAQANACDVKFMEHLPSEQSAKISDEYDLILDAIFGFSFKGEIREPFLTLIQQLKESKLPVVSVDIPSGWNVETGENSQGFEQPECLVSLSAPKQAAAMFKGTHYLGGRFMPPSLLDKYNCRPPVAYQGSDQFLRLN